MTALQAANYISNANRTEGEGKQFLEDMLARLKEVPGGAAQSELTIDTGEVTPTGTLHSIDTESDDPADTLTNIALDNLSEGAFLYLWGEDAARVVTVQHLNSATDGEIRLAGAANIDLNVDTPLVLKRVGVQWVQVLFGGGSADEVEFDPAGLTHTDATDVQEALEDLDGAITGKNFLVNGSMAVSQDGTSFTSATTPANNDDTYLLDQWVLLSDGNDTVDVTQSTDVPTGAFRSIALDVETANRKFGIFQPLTASQAAALIGGDATLSFYAKVSDLTNLDNVKAAIVTWSGTADSITSDIVSAWGVEGTNPTLAANWTYENTPVNLNVTDSWARFSVTGNIDTPSAANVGVFIWSDVTTTTVGGADILYVTNVQLEQGTVASAFDHVALSDELRSAFFFYQRFSSPSAGGRAQVGLAASTSAFQVALPTGPMRVTPSISINDMGVVSSGSPITVETASVPWHSGPVTTIQLNDAGSGFTIGAVYTIRFNTANTSYIKLDARL